MDATKILSRNEVATVLKDLKRRAKRSENARLNLIIFRLSCCCGLRCKEIIGINLGDVNVSGDRPSIRIRKAITKGQEGKKRARVVPLWWDRGTLEDLARWKEHRAKMGAGKDDPFVCALRTRGNARGKRLTRHTAAKRWITAIRSIGGRVSIHKGRHSFCTHAIAIGRSLTEVRNAAGHASVSSTNVYLECIERDGVKDLFEFGQ